MSSAAPGHSLALDRAGKCAAMKPMPGFFTVHVRRSAWEITASARPWLLRTRSALRLTDLYPGPLGPGDAGPGLGTVSRDGRRWLPPSQLGKRGHSVYQQHCSHSAERGLGRACCPWGHKTGRISYSERNPREKMPAEESEGHSCSFLSHV